MSRILEGGCLCDAVQYRITISPTDVGYCHCRICQRSSGAPALPWLTVPVADFAYTRGTPRIYRSSAHSHREFCGTCGSPLAFRRTHGATTVDVTVVSLRDPSLVPPRYHIWRQSRIAWFETTDALPRYDDAGPDKHDP